MNIGLIRTYLTTVTLACALATQAQAPQSGSLMGLDFVLTPETSHVLLPARAISVQPELVTGLTWARQQPALAVTTQANPGAGDFITRLAKPTTAMPQTLSLWLPGQREMRPVASGVGLRVKSFDVVPESTFGIVHLVSGQEESVQILPFNGSQVRQLKLPKEVTGQVIVSKSRAWAMMVGSSYQGKNASVSINLLNLQTGEWMESYNTREQPYSFSGALYLEKDDQVAIGLRGVNGQAGQTAIIEPLSGRVAEVLPFESFAEFYKQEQKSASVPMYQTIPTLERGVASRGPNGVLRVQIKPSSGAGAASFYLPGVNLGEASYDGKYLAVVSSNMVGIREFAQTKTDAFKALLAQHEARQLLEAVKQVGLAFLMYLADHNDQFPSGDAWQPQIQEYLLNKDQTLGFEFRLANAKLSGIQDPGKTVLGVIQGQFGTATVYADGSAKWTANK